MPEEGLVEPSNRNVQKGKKKKKAAISGGQMNRGKALKEE